MDDKYKDSEKVENYLNNIEPKYYKYNAVNITPVTVLPDIVLKKIKEAPEMNDDLISRKVISDESHFITTISECGTEVACYGLTINEIEQIIDNAPKVDMNTALSVAYLKGRMQGGNL